MNNLFIAQNVPLSSSELGLATKKLLTQRFEFDMREMNGNINKRLWQSIFIDL